MSEKVIIEYYSDVLCVWAWIAQRRLDELNASMGEQIEFRYHYIDVFGAAETKIHKQWAERGLYQGFSEHVINAAEGFEEAPVNSAAWAQTKPKTSANAHLFLKAVELAHGAKASQDLALAVRKAFFVEAQDIGNMEVLLALLSGHGFATAAVSLAITNGGAIAALMQDYQLAKQQGIKGSPSYVIDNGRQILYGNVGYRVLQANIEELLKNTQGQASWC